MKKILLKTLLEKEKIKRKICDNSAQGAIDVAIICLLSVVLGALILAGLYALINGEVMPAISQRIKDMFNYTH